MWEKIKSYLLQEATMAHYMIGSAILLAIVVMLVLS